MTLFQVVVGNIGTVYDGPNGLEARVAFNQYVGHSRDGYGRAAGEPVTLWRDGEIEQEHMGTWEEEP